MNQPLSIFDDPIMTIPDVAKYLKISRSKAYYMVSSRQLPYLRLGKNVRIRQSDLLKWLDEQIEKQLAV